MRSVLRWSGNCCHLLHGDSQLCHTELCVHQPSRDWPYKRRKAIFLFTCEQKRCVTSQRIFWLHQDWWFVPVKPTSLNWTHTRPHVKTSGCLSGVILLLFLDIMHGTIFFKMRCWQSVFYRSGPRTDALFQTNHSAIYAHYYDNTRSPLCAESLCASFELRPLEDVLLL